jgi:hypothetical protein
MKSKEKIKKKDIEKLKPIIILKDSKKEAKKESKEELDEDFEEEQVQQRPSNFNSPVIPFKAPVLEKTNASESLESEISNIPSSSSTSTGQHREAVYVQNLPKYSGADYSSRNNQGMNEDRDTRTDKQVNIMRARENVNTQLDERRSINMGLWQNQNIFNRQDMQREDDRDYVLRANEKKDKDRLPFQ